MPRHVSTRPRRPGDRHRRLAMVSLIGGVALGPRQRCAHQREAQNGADAVANAGATVLSERLGGAVKTDSNVAAR